MHIADAADVDVADVAVVAVVAVVETRLNLETWKRVYVKKPTTIHLQTNT